MPRILIADDQADVVAALSLLLKGERFQIQSASSPAGVLKSLDGQEFDVVLIDLNYARDTTSGSEGLDLLSKIQAVDPSLPVVVMTAWGSVDLAVEAMRRGARDFIQKPCSLFCVRRWNSRKRFAAAAGSKRKTSRCATAFPMRARRYRRSSLSRRRCDQCSRWLSGLGRPTRTF